MRIRLRSDNAASDAVEAIVAGVVIQATVMLTGILAARMLGPENRGALALIWVLTLILAQVGTLGVPAAVTFYLARGRLGGGADGVARLLRLATFQTGPLVVLHAIVLTVLLAGSRLSAGLVTLAALPAMIGQLYGLAVLQGLSRLRAMQVLRALPTALYAGGLMTAFVVGEHALVVVAASWTGSYVASAGLTLATAFRDLRATGEVTRAVSGAALVRFGSRAMFGSVSPLETFRLDQLVVGLVLSLHELGLYVTALAFTTLPRLVAQGLGMAAVARISPMTQPDAIRRAVRVHVGVCAACALAIAVPLACLAKPLIVLFFGPSFAGAAPIVRIVLIGTVVTSVRRVLGDGLRAAGHPGPASIAELASYVFVLPGLLVAAAVGDALSIAWVLAGSSLAALLVLGALAWNRGLVIQRSIAAGALP